MLVLGKRNHICTMQHKNYQIIKNQKQASRGRLVHAGGDCFQQHALVREVIFFPKHLYLDPLLCMQNSAYPFCRPLPLSAMPFPLAPPPVTFILAFLFLPAFSSCHLHSHLSSSALPFSSATFTLISLLLACLQAAPPQAAAATITWLCSTSACLIAPPPAALPLHSTLPPTALCPAAGPAGLQGC